MIKKMILFGYKKGYILFLVFLCCNLPRVSAQTNLEELLSYPFPKNLCTSTSTGNIAWTFNTKGKRNIYISTDKGKTFTKLTDYAEDDGQDINRLQFSADGRWLVYVRGAETGANWSGNQPVNPTSSPLTPSFQLIALHLSDKKTKVLDSAFDTNTPALSPDSKMVTFIKNGSVWIVPIDGSKNAKRLFYSRGKCGYLNWSPDGKRLAFVTNRGNYSLIGIYTDNKTPIHWLDPSFSRDIAPEWSPGGDSIVFIRRPAIGGAPDSILARPLNPWEIRVADIEKDSSKLLWKSPNTLNGAVPTTDGNYNLKWAAKNKIIFLNTLNNWPHLYSMPSNGGKPLLLTPGNFMVEHVSLSPDKEKLIFSANTGNDRLDIDRRHIGTVSVDKADMKMRTQGDGIEAFPVFINNNEIALISSTAIRPALPAVLISDQQNIQLIGGSLLSTAFNTRNLVTPKQVIFNAPDGTSVHAQLFQSSEGSPTKKPAVVSIHGGPARQMLLGWSYSEYYAAQYAVNQLLAQKGFVVLSVNYRLGIGYGNAFHRPADGGRYGASEYQDVLAAGEWLLKQPFVDEKRIGVYGGSYGGYLTAFALARNSDIFAAGVDIHGVHNMVPTLRYASKFEHAPDAALADSIAWKSSPIADVHTWKSPVLLIHADDDRNVDFNESINLYNRLKKQGVYVETMIIPDETHHWMRFHNLVKIYRATVEFLDRKVMNKK